MPVPLSHVKGGLLKAKLGEVQQRGVESLSPEAVAHVTLLFTLDTDPADDSVDWLCSRLRGF